MIRSAVDRRRLVAGALFLAAVLFLPAAVLGETQSFSLAAGWNAVFLEVQPNVSGVQGTSQLDALLYEKPIDRVVTYYPADSPVTFIQDPEEIPWETEGWHRWLSPSTPDAALLTNLFALQAGHAYLIHAAAPCELAIEGDLKFRPLQWVPGSFNLVGFAVDPAIPPTFAGFFASSPAHRDLVAYTLADNRWVRVQTPERTTIKAGRAYWIYCPDTSDYNGPLDILLPAGEEKLVFPAGGVLAREVVFTNTTAEPMSVTLALAGDVPLRIENRPSLAAPPEYADVREEASWPVLSPGERRKVRFAVRWTGGEAAGTKTAALTVSDGRGGRYRIPVEATR